MNFLLLCPWRSGTVALLVGISCHLFSEEERGEPIQGMVGTWRTEARKELCLPNLACLFENRMLHKHSMGIWREDLLKL